MFVPSAGTVLVDWGADVVKVEHPVTGDPQRGLVTSGLLPGGDSGINFMMEQPNRGKRSVAIDIAKPDGHEAFMRLIEGADVYLTNYLPQVRRKLRVDVDDVRARNPQLVVARGSGQGARGPTPRRAATTPPRSGPAAVWPRSCPRTRRAGQRANPRRPSGTSWAASRPPVRSRRRCSSGSAPVRPPSWTCRCSPRPCGSSRRWWWRPSCSG